MKQDHIHIKGARMHNLKNVDVKIPHGKLTVITGLSGSGKSSLAFDTLYAEGQRRYIESLSSYARQFLGKLDKPEVDFIKGISPAVAIEQKVSSTNPRSTVGTTTEIYDYLKILFARIGKTISPISGEEVKKHNISDIVDYIHSKPKGTKGYILAPIHSFEKYGTERQLKLLQDQGYVRLWIDNEVVEIETLIAQKKLVLNEADLIVDRIKVDAENEDNVSRIGDSAQLAFIEGDGECKILTLDDNHTETFSNKFELDGMEFAEPSIHLFAFNNPFGACKKCEGFGSVIGIDPNLVIPNKSLSVYDGAVVAWKGEKMSQYLDEFVYAAPKFDFPIHRPVQELTEKELDALWNGNQYTEGIAGFFKMVESNSYKIQYRVMLSRYRGKTLCPDCSGTRLRKDANYVKVANTTLKEIVLMPINVAFDFFKNLKLDKHDTEIANRIFPEITNRLRLICEVGLEYLTLNRQANSLSGGESQRINLATSLGSSLVGSMYILDEPSIGLHPKDTDKLIGVLKDLRDVGNTVIVVEHEEAMMQAADEIIDIGPKAGVYGGEIVFQGDHKKLVKSGKSLTADYLTKKREIPYPKSRRKIQDKLEITGAKENNLKNVDATFPLHNLVCVTGVSGSGKSTLVTEILYPAVRKSLGQYGDKTGEFTSISGDLSSIKAVEYINQNPIGRSSRSNPVTYVKAFDEIRDLFSRQNTAKVRGYRAGYFSFNVEGGRCEMCQGEGQVTVGMQFMADVHLECEACHGTRYKTETLEVKYKDHSIADILNLSIGQALEFFRAGGENLTDKIADKIQPLVDVGLGYLSMGQPSSTLSGGEAQRIKLASFLSLSKNPQHTLFIFDEPTTGLHFYDIEKLLIALNRLIDVGHSVVVIEHDLDVIKNADYIIDIGPEGGVQGGNILFQGTPEELVKCKESYTGKFLKDKL